MAMQLPKVSATHKGGAIFVPTTFIENVQDLSRFINKLASLMVVFEENPSGSEE